MIIYTYRGRIMMRCKQCEITDPERIREILSSVNIGRLATNGADGYPYITPVNFVFYKEHVYFHCALEGEKLDNVSRDPKVCFEVDVPLAYLEVTFNPERNPCRTHQFFHCVIIRGGARIIPDGELKTAALNALVKKHEGNTEFTPITPDSLGYKTCRVMEVTPEKMTAKSDLGQRSPQRDYLRYIAENLVKRGLPGDLKAVREMGFTLEVDEKNRYKLKE